MEVQNLYGKNFEIFGDNTGRVYSIMKHPSDSAKVLIGWMALNQFPEEATYSLSTVIKNIEDKFWILI